MKKFLFATDFSVASSNSFQYIRELIQDKAIIIDMINVFEIPIGYTTQATSTALSGYVQELRESSRKKMDALMAELPLAQRGNVHPVQGIYPSSEIDECAEEIKADLIIMSLRKDYGIMKRFMGSTTSRTIAKSIIPVLAIPARAKYKEIKDVLFPSAIEDIQDLSDRERSGILWLNKFSGFLDHPNIELIHIIEDSDYDTRDVTIPNKYTERLKLTHSHASSVEVGVYQYMIRKHPHLLAFYKPHRSLWEGLYRFSKTRHILYDSMTPLLIFG